MGLGMGNVVLGKGGQDILPAGLPFMLQMVVGTPACLTCTSTVIVTETGAEEVTTPLLELMTKR